ncbi:transketolase [Burkholderia pseudomallei]|uniref:transketolase n=1 Tax=Burkholderia pseudomallei TaxID=28450 RepID=UPI0006DCFDC7|nr:transketolase [Burkholderia pseudomallei]
MAMNLDNQVLENRKRVLKMLHGADGGHFGGAMSVLDTLVVLYHRVLRRDPARRADGLADRLILSKGHASVALYAVLASIGELPEAELATYGKGGGRLPCHPDMTLLDAVDFSTGSLGQGLSVGLGMAFALRGTGARVWVVLGDGECQEGQVWEAAQFASRYGVDNLHAVVDLNGFQEMGGRGIDGVAPEPLPDAARKWAAFGWHVREVAGHDAARLEAAMRAMTAQRGRPSVLLASTVKGRGIPAFEFDPGLSHCTSLTDDQFRHAVAVAEGVA